MRHHFSHYDLLMEIDHDERGTTYLARPDAGAEHKVILKTFAGSIDEVTRRRLLELFDTLKRSGHPHLVPVLEAGIEEGELYTVSEYVTGGSLRVRLDRAHPETLPLQHTLVILLSIGQALAALHRMHLVHGHLKPEHILFDAEGQALLMGAFLTIKPPLWPQKEATSASALRYRAPEQSEGAGDALSDQYALCCIAYELLTGQPPFPENDASLLQQRKLQEAPAPLSAFVPDLPAVVEAAILKGLASDPGQRHPDIPTLLALLQPASVAAELPLPRAKRTRKAPPRSSSPVGRASKPAPASPSASLLPDPRPGAHDASVASLPAVPAGQTPQAPDPAQAGPASSPPAHGEPAARLLASAPAPSKPAPAAPQPIQGQPERATLPPGESAGSEQLPNGTQKAPAPTTGGSGEAGSTPAGASLLLEDPVNQADALRPRPVPPPEDDRPGTTRARRSEQASSAPLSRSVRTPIEEAETLLLSLSADPQEANLRSQKPHPPAAPAPANQSALKPAPPDKAEDTTIFDAVLADLALRQEQVLASVSQDLSLSAQPQGGTPGKALLANQGPLILPAPAPQLRQKTPFPAQSKAAGAFSAFSRKTSRPSVPWFKRPRSGRLNVRALLWILVLLLFIGSLITYAVLATSGFPASPTPSLARATATATRPSGTPTRPGGTPTIIAATPTPSPRPTATVLPQPIVSPAPSPTATHVSPTPTRTPVSSQPLYIFPLQAQSSQPGTYVITFEQNVMLKNFKLQATMTITQGGDGGGLVFRSDGITGGTGYRFRIGADGTYDLQSQNGAVASGSSSAIHTGLNQSNLLTVIANGTAISIEVNNHLLVSVHNTASSSGYLGLMAVDFTNPTSVTCTVKVYA